jgi:hypothetical protein
MTADAGSGPAAGVGTDAAGASWRDRLPDPPDGSTLVFWAVVLNTEFLLVAGYYLFAADVTLRDPFFAAVPFVWLNLAVWAVARADVPPAPGRKKAVAAGVAVGYFLLLAVFGGVVNGPSALSGVTVNVLQLPPGWNPALLYNGPVVSLVVLPYKLVGFAALAYLVYATVLDAASVLVGGVLGLFSCVSCTLPIIAGIAAGLFGGGSAVAGFASANSYLLSTAVFGVTVLLLSWRPTAR